MKFSIPCILSLCMSVMLSDAGPSVIEDMPGLVLFYRGDSLLDLGPYGNNLIHHAPEYNTITSAPFSASPRNVFKLDNSQPPNYNMMSDNTRNIPYYNSPRTMMTWMKVTGRSSMGSAPISYGFGGAYYSNWGLRVEGEDNPRIHSIATKLSPSDTIVANAEYDVWHHYTLTYENRVHRCYVDGVLTLDATVDANLNTASAKFMMGDINGKGQYDLAEIVLFNRVLTMKEIRLFSSGRAGGGGDPHLYAFGGRFFSWQGHCDVVLLKSPKTKNGDTMVEMHIRTRRVRSWSAIDSIAIKSGENVSEIESNKGTLTLNGHKVDKVKTDSLSINKSQGSINNKRKKRIVTYTFTFDENKILTVEVNTRTKMLFVNLMGDYPRGTTGVLGSPYNPGQIGRDGTNMTEASVNEFVENWQVRDTDLQLFHQNRHPHYPSKCLYEMADIQSSSQSRRLKELSKVSRAIATSACAAHPAGPLRDFCVQDVMATGDLEISEDTFYG